MMLNTRGLLLLVTAFSASVMAYPIKQEAMPRVANGWLNGEVQQLSRGSLIAGRHIPGTVATALDVKGAGSRSPFAALNAGLDPVSSDCLCLKPGNPALDGRGALRIGGAAALPGAAATTAAAGLGMAADHTSGLVAARDGQPELRADTEELAHSAARNGGSWGWTDERSKLSFQSAPGTSGSELFAAADQGSIRGGFGFGGGIGGGGGVFSGGNGTVNPGGFSGGTDQLEPEAISVSAELALGTFASAGSPDTGSFTVLAAGVGSAEQRLLALNLGSVKEHELLENSVRFYTAMSRGTSSSVDTPGRDGIDDSGALFGWRAAVEKESGDHGAMRGHHDGGGAGDSTTTSAPSFSWYTSGDTGRQEITERTFAGAEPEVARRIATALSTVSEGFDDSHALRSVTGAVDPVTELQTAVTGVDVMVSSSAPRLDGVVDTSREAPMPLTTAQVPEPSTFVMAAIAAALVLFGAFGARKAS